MSTNKLVLILTIAYVLTLIFVALWDTGVIKW